MSEVLKLSENPLLQAEKALVKIGKIATACLFIPIPLIALTTAGFFFFRHNWYLDPFLALIYALFCLGQITALSQIRGVGAGVLKTSAAVKVLRDAGDEPDLEKLRIALLQDAPPGHLRDLLLRWIELGLRGETHGSESLLDNAWERRSLTDGRTLSMHVSLNRTTLKLGFLGTLIGLIMTFPPMKRAVMSLSESEGEMRFIRDLVAAIDGDEYAILNTLVATAISIMIELVTLQILERALIGFDLVNSHINDWNLTRLQPLIRQRHAKEKASGLVLPNESKMAEAQAAMNRNMGILAEAVHRTAQQLEQVGLLQAQIGKRITELTEYERQYRSFLNAKQGAIAPAALRPRVKAQAENMRRHRSAHRLEMGEAISFEDVLTVITVLLLLRVLFMVPLVNLDKAKTVRAKEDAYWPAETQWVLSQKHDSLATLPFATTFDLTASHVVLSQRGAFQFMEAVTPDSSLFILRHNLAESTYVSMRVQGRGHSKAFRRGRLLWSSAEQEWFTASDSVDYGEHVLSKGLEKQQREFTRQVRGY